MKNPSDTYPASANGNIVSKTILIHAPTAVVWETLTDPELMKKWMSETDIDIRTNWRVGTPFVIRGILHRVNFENRGTILQFEPERILQYTHWSSISRLADEPENYTILTFSLTAIDHQTKLAFTASNFPTETIYKHFAFYWNVTLEILKRMIEKTDDPRVVGGG